MRPASRPVRWAILTAFLIWFVHFLLCWAAVEVWPGQGLANRLAWGFTVLALLAMGLHALQVRRLARSGRLGRSGDVAGFNHRFAQGAIAIATVAVLFTALPTLVFLP